MYLELKDDSVIEIEGDDTGTDYKWPVSESEYDTDFLELEVHE